MAERTRQGCIAPKRPYTSALNDRQRDLFPETDPPSVKMEANKDLFRAAVEVADANARALIDQLIAATRLYDSKAAFLELLDFTSRLRRFAPFNAMLLHIQKPGLSHAATAPDWWARFKRLPKTGARPLLILRTKGPVDFVFDIQDTEGEPVPESAFAFPTLGNLSEPRLSEILSHLPKNRIQLSAVDLGDQWAGWIKCTWKSPRPKGRHEYLLGFNKNHAGSTRLVTVAHELGHLFLGHLGADPGRRVPDRRDRDLAFQEIEAETVAYLVARRNGLKPKSEGYLDGFDDAFSDLDIHAVMRAVNAVETVMGISGQSYWDQSQTIRLAEP